MNKRLSAILTEMKASYPHNNPAFRGVGPKGKLVPTVTAHEQHDRRVKCTFQENGGKVVRANLIYSQNGNARHEEWFRAAATLPGGNTVTAELPEGISLTTWQDDSRYLRGRLDLLLRNARTSLVLVFFMLALFLRLRLAIWITFGIAFSFLGTLWVLPFLGVSISLISLFAFILALGIVVDDAIVTGENIHTWYLRTGDGLQSAIKGTQEVATPVIFGVLTTIAAFVPLLLVPGNTGKIMKVIPLVVISALFFSLIESKTALPTHLKHLKHRDTPRRGLRGAWQRLSCLFRHCPIALLLQPVWHRQ